MTEPTSNPNRPAQYRVTRGTILKGKTVTTPHATPAELQALEHARTADRQVVVRTEGGTEGTVKLANIERTFRTAEERELGREFSPEEARAHEQRWELRIATMTEERARAAITLGVETIAERLERAAADLRRELASELSSPAEKARRAQHAVAWLFPNLGADDLTQQAIDWTLAKHDITRLLTEGLTES
jgi:hypothetical protein